MRPRARVLLALPLAFFVAFAVFWYGPTKAISCADSNGWYDHFATIDGPGGPDARYCEAPSAASWLLMASAASAVILLAAALDVTAQLTGAAARARERRPRVRLDADGDLL